MLNENNQFSISFSIESLGVELNVQMGSLQNLLINVCVLLCVRPPLLRLLLNSHSVTQLRQFSAVCVIEPIY